MVLDWQWRVPCVVMLGHEILCLFMLAIFDFSSTSSHINGPACIACLDMTPQDLIELNFTTHHLPKMRESRSQDVGAHARTCRT